ncbi:hypothetical protein QAD02_012657 [Eretmocerus hayati]|uniref:Uncharacterized protein n=1 Tax=Eretmocerus hayati TaxID=131215 RepID=A0ACC2P008_9HYME|nr:hypothetical protein QAD02_012657 [Eretmocerus hayati]
MAPWSDQLAGVVLRHNKFSSHLNSSGKTIDKELLKNFAHAGETLSELWNELFLDDHPITRREDRRCCRLPRSNLRTILPTGFLPPPVLVRYDRETGLLEAVPLEIEDSNARFLPLFQRLALSKLNIPTPFAFKEMPYDLYCPSVRSEISGRTCRNCGTYFVSEAAITRHMKDLQHSITVRTLQRSKIVAIEAQRNEEVLCIMQQDGTNIPTAEWMMEDDIQDHDTDNCIDNRRKESNDNDFFPVINDLRE